MKETLILNLESIFYPISTIKKRYSKNYQLSETIVFIWPFFIFFTLFEIFSFYWSASDVDFDFVFIPLLLVKALFFPALLIIDVLINFLSLRILLGGDIDDRKINALIGCSLSAGVLFIIPLAGDIIVFFVSKLILFLGVRSQSDSLRAFVALIFPFLLSTTFVAFILLCFVLIYLFLFASTALF